MLTSHELLGFMSPALALEILSYTHESDKPLYRATLNAVAEARKLRPVFLERQPRAQRHATMLATLARPALELFTGNLIRNWLLKNIVGNWEIAPVYVYQSGQHVTPQSGTDSNLNGDSAPDRTIINPSGDAKLGSAVTALKNSAGDTVALLETGFTETTLGLRGFQRA